MKLQHYGCKTRLLDLTTNALVALYFACHEKKHHRTNGELIILDIPNDQIKYFDSDTVAILSAISVQPIDFEITKSIKTAETQEKLKKVIIYLNNMKVFKVLMRQELEYNKTTISICQMGMNILD